jgi:hypothetical protein
MALSSADPQPRRDVHPLAGPGVSRKACIKSIAKAPCANCPCNSHEIRGVGVH